MPLRRHRLGLSKLKAKLDKLRVKIKGEKSVSPFVVVRLGSGRVQTKAVAGKKTSSVVSSESLAMSLQNSFECCS